MFSFIENGSISTQKVFWVGILMAIFNPPIVGLVYALCFIGKKETRNLSYIVGVWAVVWTVIYYIIFRTLVSSGILLTH